MSKILVGIDGSERGERALAWAAERTRSDGSALTLLLVVDPRFTRGPRAESEGVMHAAHEALGRASALVSGESGIRVEERIAEGKVLETIIDAAKEHDLVALGSHHGSSARETIGGAKGLRVAVSTTTPTAVVPSDWSEKARGKGIVVGVAADDSSDAAIGFGVAEARRTGEKLSLVSAWGLPAFLARPAKALGGELVEVGAQYQQRLDGIVARLAEEHPGLEVEGRAVEGASPTRALLDYCAGRGLLVLGTRTTTALGRTLFGSLTHSMLVNLEIPTVVVPGS